MQSFLFVNAFFEEELCFSYDSLFDLLYKHPLYFQLQYLSFLVVESSQIPLVSEIPEQSYCKHLSSLGLLPSSYHLLSNRICTPAILSSWGRSSTLEKFCKQNLYCYNTPSQDIVQTVQSKQFSFLYFPRIPFSSYIQTDQELSTWWDSLEGAKVLKNCYGSSGRGHCISQGSNSDYKKALLFFHKNSSALIAQPWVERVLDFSSQWDIKQNGSYEYLGATICQNSAKGSYLASITGPEKQIFANHLEALEEHFFYAKKAIKLLISHGFFGNVGFDAMIYKDPATQKHTLLPILEINARKTMGWVCLQLYQKLARERPVAIRYVANAPGLIPLLPSHHLGKTFPKQLFLDISPSSFAI